MALVYTARFAVSRSLVRVGAKAQAKVYAEKILVLRT